jgi:hypothetical protein
MVAEVKLIDPADRHAGRGEDGFIRVGCFMVGVYETQKQVAEMVQNPDASPTDKFPMIYTEEFAEMVLLWERVSDVTELGSALGDLRECGT